MPLIMVERLIEEKAEEICREKGHSQRVAHTYREDAAKAIITKQAAELAELRAGIKRISDEEELLAETTDGDMFSMVSLAAKLAHVEKELEEETNRLQGKIEDYAEREGNALNDLEDAESRATTAEAECLRLREERDEALKALEPFATVGRVIEGPFGAALFDQDDEAFKSGCAWTENGERKTLTWGDFRRARSALQQGER